MSRCVDSVPLTMYQQHYDINILIVIDIFYKEHAIIVMIMLCMFILGDRFIKAIIACFRILSVFTMFDVLYILIIFLINIVKTVNI